MSEIVLFSETSKKEEIDEDRVREEYECGSPEVVKYLKEIITEPNLRDLVIFRTSVEYKII